MSALTKVKLAQCKDIATARTAVVKMNKEAESFLFNDSKYRGYSSYRDIASVPLVLRKEFFGGVEDIGWVKEGDHYSIQYDQDDRRKIQAACGTGAVLFEESFNQYYNACLAEQTLVSQGYSCETVKVGDELHVQATCWA